MAAVQLIRDPELAEIVLVERSLDGDGLSRGPRELHLPRRDRRLCRDDR